MKEIRFSDKRITKKLLYVIQNPWNQILIVTQCIPIEQLVILTCKDIKKLLKMPAKLKKSTLNGSKLISEKVKHILVLSNTEIQLLHIGKDIEKVQVKLLVNQVLIMRSHQVENTTKNSKKKKKLKIIDDFVIIFQIKISNYIFTFIN